MFYGLWKYADVTGSARPIFDASQSKLDSPPSDSYLIEYPYVHNAYIAGYLGYLELEALAGYSESTEVKGELARLLQLRASTFDKDAPEWDSTVVRSLNVARNFMYLVPELGQYLRANIYQEAREAIDEYTTIAPYWFVADQDATAGEGANQHFYDYWALFQAKAHLLQEPPSELVKYLDVPAVQVGDLYYIQNLVAVLEAGLASGLEKTGFPASAAEGDTVTFTLSFSGHSTGTFTIRDTLPVGVSAPMIADARGIASTPTYDSDTHEMVWHGERLTEEEIVLRYQVTVDTDQPALLENVAELDGPDSVNSTASFTVIANAQRCFLPLAVRRK
jgi:hypothetical protein